ncbi:MULTISPECIES: sigma-70 family RNA polymerase sigma factor [Bhargavaea]|uniref:Sigma-70 family RNA polymerase sigma factor n=1 Tax=Bhargavaea changchunensis TaxID=2134037 RepID=A0ABW2NAI6_9BACL|nr:sigma-70 family RNA polymerase sigma factor [Bhargavaea sp. CC-171006]
MDREEMPVSREMERVPGELPEGKAGADMDFDETDSPSDRAESHVRSVGQIVYLPERNRIIEENLHLVNYVVCRFRHTNIPADELTNIGAIGLIKAVDTFDRERNVKLSTYASRCIKNEILMHLRKAGKTRLEVSLEQPLGPDLEGNGRILSEVLGMDEDMDIDLEREYERAQVTEAVSRLEERERFIVESRFAIGGREELTQQELSEKLGISQSYISRLEKRIAKDLRRFLRHLDWNHPVS